MSRNFITITGKSAYIGAAFSGIIGVGTGSAVADNALIVVIIGGLGSIPGVFVGALLLIGIPELLREFAEYRLWAYGVLLVLMMTYEVFARYLFRSPTIWVYEMSFMVNGAAFMLGCAYALYKGAHVRTDIFWDNYSQRTKGIVDLVSYLVLFFPVMITLMVSGLPAPATAAMKPEIANAWSFAATALTP